jgi:hypothetical protein
MKRYESIPSQENPNEKISTNQNLQRKFELVNQITWKSDTRTGVTVYPQQDTVFLEGRLQQDMLQFY